ncbi:WAT1-related protein [Spatholobus suberectus]|nr:WAT1-related protein [Spatholobus suberectus]
MSKDRQVASKSSNRAKLIYVVIVKLIITVRTHGTGDYELVAYFIGFGCAEKKSWCGPCGHLHFGNDGSYRFIKEIYKSSCLQWPVGITLAMGLFYYGLRETSATYSVNFLNLVPIFTFIVSIILRMERLRLHTWTSKVKTMGAILCVGGALTTSLYKGKEFYIVQSSHHTHSTVEASKTNMLRGTLFLVGSCLSYTAWFIVQVKLLEIFPFKYWGTMLTCIIASIQATIVGICLDCRKVTWSLKWNLQLMTIIYSGALATAATFCLIYWAIAIKGPTYPTMFNPLALIFVAISEAILLGEPIRLGMLLGITLILMGLYSFLWGKGKETQCMLQASGEVLTSMTAESAGVHSTALVVPSFSPSNAVLGVEKTDRN